MKIIFYNIIVLFFLINTINAQNWNTKIGVNTISILAGSYELTTETTNKSIYSIVANFGYAQGKGIRTMCKVGDYIDDRKNSGYFFKIGGKLYLFNLFNHKKDDFFLGILIIGSEYKSSGFDKISENLIESNGFIWGLAYITGYKTKLSKRLELDIGGQFSFPQKRKDLFGHSCFNYQPGMGSYRSYTLLYQFIFNIKYRIGKENQV